jgi:glycosyltransferase involved in cell wall biosynthesis
VNNHTFFSIIITCYNYETYIETCIESALGQTYPRFEVIVIDDGSTDRSCDIIERYADRLTAIRTENNGFVSACLTGLASSKGDYVLFLDADDVLNETALSTVAERLHPEVTKVQFQLQPINAQGNPIGDPIPSLPADYGTLEMIRRINAFGSYPTPPTSGNIYRRDIYFRVGSIAYDFGIDGVAYLFAPFAGEVIHIPEALGKYRIHDKNMSGYGVKSDAGTEKFRRVYRMRLEHLARLVTEQNVPDHKRFSIKKDYLYLTENTAFDEVTLKRRLSFITMVRYLDQIRTSLAGFDRASRMVFAVLLFVLPHKEARRLLDFKINPGKPSKFRIMIKRLAGG